MHASSAGSISSYKRFVDSFTVSVRDFGDGEREVMVRRYDDAPLTGSAGVQHVLDAQRRPEVGQRSKTRLVDPGPFDEAFDLEAYRAWRDARADFDARRAENRGRAARRARGECVARLKAIKADRMLTLTYAENMTDRAVLARHWKEFVRRIRRSVPGFEYVATHERQKRGAWHMHIAVRGRQNVRLVRAVWRSVVGMGNIDVTARNPFKERALRHKLASYMSKYIAKNAHEGELGERRLWCSKGIDKAERQVNGFRFASWPDAVDRAMALLDPELPLVAWYSSRRDLMFFATTKPV